jgi:3D (Asp-Asp-Asp) domain-containing protein
MHIYIQKEDNHIWMKRTIALTFSICFLAGAVILISLNANRVEADFVESADFIVSSMQGNTLIPISNPFEPVKVKRVEVLITAYSSTVWQTDDTPFITASGEWVRDGIVANNMLPFGTRITIPELYGDKMFVVEDRMNQRKGNYHVDIWFPEYKQAKDFGTKLTYVEIIEN